MTKLAIFAAGCFWGIEEKFLSQRGVLDTEVGYTGGITNEPSYHDVCSGETGHAEAVRVKFDQDIVSYEELVSLFFEMHDPMKKAKTQYSSSIFVCDEEQLRIAEEEVYKLGPLCTTFIEPLTSWTDAEKKHQNYLEKRAVLKRKHNAKRKIASK